MFPPRAESVDSFSHRSGIGQPESRNLTGESVNGAKGLSRRATLAGLAILPTTVSGLAAVSVDPIFAAIDEHRKAHAAHLWALDEINRLEKVDGSCDWADIAEQPCHADNDTFEILLGTAAATIPGLLAKLTYLRTFAAGNESWMLDEHEGVSLALIDSFTASLRNAGVLS
jgi:hypothetical protein